MKLHINALLQRKRTEFEGGRNLRGLSQSVESDETTVVQMKDGYDWLALIQQNQVTRVSAHS